jgi:hypothetical protein
MSTDNIALMWDCNGLEAAINVDDIQRQRTWAALKNEDASRMPPPVPILQWQLRARYNPQRHYEIYIISVDDGVTVDDIVSAFEANPQGMADTVRRIGHCFYSDRYDQEEVRIR